MLMRPAQRCRRATRVLAISSSEIWGDEIAQKNRMGKEFAAMGVIGVAHLRDLLSGIGWTSISLTGGSLIEDRVDC
jgi:hypothetical protein